MDRYDVGEFAGLAGLVGFCALVWAPLALLVGSVALLLEVNLRSRGRAPVRNAGPSRVARVLRAARSAWADEGERAA